MSRGKLRGLMIEPDEAAEDVCDIVFNFESGALACSFELGMDSDVVASQLQLLTEAVRRGRLH